MLIRVIRGSSSFFILVTVPIPAYTGAVTIEQTVEIGRDRRVLRLDRPLPETVGAGRSKITLIFPDAGENAPGDNDVPQPGMTVEPTWDELHAEARAKAAYYQDRPFISLSAEGLDTRSREQIIKDAVAEVRMLRDEWDD